MKYIVIGLVLVGVLGVMYIGLSNPGDNQNHIDTSPNIVVDEAEPAEETPQEVGIDDLILVTAPQPGATVSTPIQVSGEARGYWFFEATAPVVVTNWDGLILGEGYVEAEGDWMTEVFVPFSGEITYEPEPNAYSATGTLIFKRANPSGRPENDQAFEMQVQLGNE